MTDPRVAVDLVLHTPGGLVLAALQIARAIHKRPGKVTVFVPHYAMSGGTLIALAADEIVMSEHAMLGPVDPQLGQYPAASILSAVARKPIQDVDDATLILADQAEKATAQLRAAVREFLADDLAPEKSDELADAADRRNLDPRLRHHVRSGQGVRPERAQRHSRRRAPAHEPVPAAEAPGRRVPAGAVPLQGAGAPGREILMSIAAGRRDVVVIGAGPAGMAAALSAAARGRRVTLVSDGQLLGDGIQGAYKSKAMWELARDRLTARRQGYGYVPTVEAVRFEEIHEQLECGVAELCEMYARYLDVYQVELVLARARFVDSARDRGRRGAHRSRHVHRRHRRPPARAAGCRRSTGGRS